MRKGRLRREFQAHHSGFLRFRSLVRRRSRKDVEEKNVQHCSLRTALTGSNLRVSLLPPLKERIQEPFRLITKEERTLVQHAFAPRNSNLLVSHHISNIDIFGETLQCLKPTAWLNDEVINLYLELLKEREIRDPQRYLKCHFFTTFFYTKLVSDGSPCSYKAVKRWTTHKKLGYQLIDCDIIFVPIHRNRDKHWALAVIHIRERNFLYLDSLDSNDFMPILNALANYLVQEVKDKSGKHIDVSSWGFQRVEDRPRQQNGYDCGMFMLKYIDFYSRGLDLFFSQKDMPNFRSRTAKEILRLQAN